MFFQEKKMTLKDLLLRARKSSDYLLLLHSMHWQETFPDFS